jgi:N-hydroxyarylamine O-acetyltransferase
MSTLDLGAYLRRIGYAGDAPATLETLARLHALHAEAIPFENLSAFIGEPIALDLASLQAKLVHGGRGGWCFEHNIHFAQVLRALGFDLTTLAARVRWNAPPGELRPRSHMLLAVRLPEGEYIADVGFGGQTLTAPLRFAMDLEQETPHDPYRLSEEAPGTFLLETRIAGAWEQLYAFDLVEQHLPDYEVSNWYLAHHPQSQFVTGVIAARTEPGLRHALRNGRYSVHRRGAATESRLLESVADFRETLAGTFRIRLPDSPQLDRKLAALVPPR